MRICLFQESGFFALEHFLHKRYFLINIGILYGHWTMTYKGFDSDHSLSTKSEIQGVINRNMEPLADYRFSRILFFWLNEKSDRMQCYCPYELM